MLREGRCNARYTLGKSPALVPAFAHIVEETGRFFNKCACVKVTHTSALVRRARSSPAQKYTGGIHLFGVGAGPAAQARKKSLSGAGSPGKRGRFPA